MRFIETVDLALPLPKWEAFVEEMREGRSLTRECSAWLESWEEYDQGDHYRLEDMDSIADVIRIQRRIGHFIGWMSRAVRAEGGNRL